MSNPLSNLIQRGESAGNDAYNAYNRGTNQNGIINAEIPIDFSRLTLGQVQSMQHQGTVYAVGKYQVIPSTLDSAVHSLRLEPNVAFTPALQERIFSSYLIVNKRPDIHNYIIGDPNTSLHDAQVSLSKEWASIGDPDRGGATHYPPHNHASISPEQAAQALNQMRSAYQASITHGMSSTEAWRTVTESNTVASASLTAPHSVHQLSKSHLLRDGTQGQAVQKLQQELSQLGYTDRHGHTLQVDGVFGKETLHAVEAFQHDHGLAVDGRVGSHTQAALQTAADARKMDAAVVCDAPAPLMALSNPNHPQHSLYTKLQGLFPEGTSEARLAQATAACHVAGMNKPDDLGNIYGNENTILFTSNSLFATMAEMDVSKPAPTVQQSLQQVQQFDQQQQLQAQQTMQQQPTQGPVMHH